MKYNDNGTYKDIYVKAFDTLPVGTEVDYDGETAPSGWTEVEEEYTLNNQPAHSVGTNNIYIDKIGNLVVINLSMFLNSISANTWTTLGNVPDELKPLNTTGFSVCIVSDSYTGNFVTYGKVEVQSNGTIRIKTQSSSSTSCGVTTNITYTI